MHLPPGKSNADALDIMPTNWRSLLTFLECQTQWRVALGMTGVIWFGLDYAGCQVVIDSVDAPASVWADLRVMEAAAQPVLNEVD